MLQEKYTPPQKKQSVITSVSLDKDVRDWIDKNIPEGARSDFINTLARDYITRERELTRRGKPQKAEAK